MPQFTAPKIISKVLKPKYISHQSPQQENQREIMGKKMKLPFLSKNASEVSRSSSSWPWPSCTQTRTLSFRTGNDIFKTINSAYFDTSTTTVEVIETPDSFFTNSSESCPSFSSTSEDLGLDPIETVIKGLRSERLFFEPKAGETSSIILEETKAVGDDNGLDVIPFKESVVLSMDSPNPIMDFRKSMEEMVEAHGLKDWEHLEELLCWYLRVNGKSNHGYIVGAFVDLLVGLAFTATTCACSCDINSPSSPLSNFYNSTSTTTSSSSTPCVSSSIETEEEVESTSSPCLSSLLEVEEDQIREEDDDNTSS